VGAAVVAGASVVGAAVAGAAVVSMALSSSPPQAAAAVDSTSTSAMERSG
jgi:hypothetical protein